MTVSKSGALTSEELFDIWKGALDPTYTEPLLSAGDGNGLEVHSQAIAQIARVSKSIDKSTQAMFLCPWSGQTDEPASGARKATVNLEFTRSQLLHLPLVLRAGQIVIAHETTDWGDPFGVTVQTGRRYVLTQNLVFQPGEKGPFLVQARAEADGEGYNNPLVGTITSIVQPGNEFENNLATMLSTNGLIQAGAVASNASLTVITPNEPDTFVPEHVGQYVQFYAGLNVGTYARLVEFFGANLTINPPTGSKGIFALEGSVQGTITDSFLDGESFKTSSNDFFGDVLGIRQIPSTSLHRMTFELIARDQAFILAPGSVLIGVVSGATFTVDSVLTFPSFLSEAPVGIVGGTSWKVVDFANDWGLTVRNIEKPSGGKLGWLDELGNDRDMARTPGETDDVYRERIKTIADVVSPNAIRRTLSRTLGSFPWCFREVGTEGLPGFFFDGDSSPPSTTPHGPLNDAYDYDTMQLTGVDPISGASYLSMTFDGTYIWALEASNPGTIHRINPATNVRTSMTIPLVVNSPGVIGWAKIVTDSTHIYATTGTQYVYLVEKATMTTVGVGDLGSTRLSYGADIDPSNDQLLVAFDGVSTSDRGAALFTKSSMILAWPGSPASPVAVKLLSTFLAFPEYVLDVVFVGGTSFHISAIAIGPYPRVYKLTVGPSSITAFGIPWVDNVYMGTPYRGVSYGGIPLGRSAWALGPYTANNVVQIVGFLAPTVGTYVATGLVDPRNVASDGVDTIWVTDVGSPNIARVDAPSALLVETAVPPLLPANHHGAIVHGMGKIFAANVFTFYVYPSPGITFANILPNGNLSFTSGSAFRFQEAVEIEDADGNNFARGWFGGSTHSGISVIRRDGSIPSPFPPFVQVRGLESGALLSVTSQTLSAYVQSSRFRVWLDYSQFRGFFSVCLPRLGLGEFGFAYGNHPSNAYDAPNSINSFFDGYPYLNALVYSRVYRAVDEVRAGGVLFDLCLDDGGCL